MIPNLEKMWWSREKVDVSCGAKRLMVLRTTPVLSFSPTRPPCDSQNFLLAEAPSLTVAQIHKVHDSSKIDTAFQKSSIIWKEVTWVLKYPRIYFRSQATPLTIKVRMWLVTVARASNVATLTSSSPRFTKPTSSLLFLSNGKFGWIFISSNDKITYLWLPKSWLVSSHNFLMFSSWKLGLGLKKFL